MGDKSQEGAEGIVEEEKPRDPVADSNIRTESDGELTDAVIDDQIIDMPEIIRHWGNVLADSEQQVKDLELDFKVWFSKQKQDYMVKLLEGKDDKSASTIKRNVSENEKTEGVINADPKEYKKRQWAIIDAQKKRDQILGLLKALKAKSIGLSNLKKGKESEFGATRR